MYSTQEEHIKRPPWPASTTKNGPQPGGLSAHSILSISSVPLCACAMSEAAGQRGLTLIVPCSAISKEEMVRPRDTGLQFCRQRLLMARHTHQPMNRGTKTFFTCSMSHTIKPHLVSLCLMVCFLDCSEISHPFSLGSLRVWYWHFMILLLSAASRWHEKKKNLAGFVKLTISAAKVQRTENLGG